MFIIIRFAYLHNNEQYRNNTTFRINNANGNYVNSILMN